MDYTTVEETDSPLVVGEDATLPPVLPFQHVMKTTKLAWLLSGLREDAEYSCQARAFTLIGPGPFTNPTIGRTEKPPPSTCLCVLQERQLV